MTKPRRPTPRSVSASTAAKNFGALVDRVREERAVYLIERAGKPVAQIGPVPAAQCTLASLAAWLETRRRLDDGYWKDVEGAVSAFNAPAVPGDPWER
jgi:antitoxin (DNA-binding transcriptional repressor) of toxin-antitoxin stability system